MSIINIFAPLKESKDTKAELSNSDLLSDSEEYFSTSTVSEIIDNDNKNPIYNSYTVCSRQKQTQENTKINTYLGINKNLEKHQQKINFKIKTHNNHNLKSEINIPIERLIAEFCIAGMLTGQPEIAHKSPSQLDFGQLNSPSPY
ncbi:hypothetical protein BB561_006466 [Smittium simulii]|uniref:Uncharacterized protein n=1 Tax=Smittium simulii TaxID=133385 RepID=A0A2T9Y434_9FUNG|nr:hypothetical protein BB561_006466 [Smittium simulii]